MPVSKRYFLVAFVLASAFLVLQSAALQATDLFQNIAGFQPYLYDKSSSSSYTIHDFRVNVDVAKFQWVLLGQDRVCDVKLDNSPGLSAMIALQGASSMFRPLPKKQYQFIIETKDGLSHHLVFRHSYRDPAFLREKIGHDSVISTGGLGVPTAHVNLYMNGEYNGVYLVLQEVDQDVVSFYLPNADLWYYVKRAWDISVTQNDEKVQTTSTDQILELNREGLSAEQLIRYDPLFQASNASKLLSQVFDYSSFSIVTLVTELYGIGDVAQHNFFLIVDPQTKKLHLMLWDIDKMLGIGKERDDLFRRNLIKSRSKIVMGRDFQPSKDDFVDGSTITEFNSYVASSIDLLNSELSAANISNYIDVLAEALSNDVTRDEIKWSRWYCNGRMDFADASEELKYIAQTRRSNYATVLASEDNQVDDYADQIEAYYADLYQCDDMYYGKANLGMYTLLAVLAGLNLIAFLVPTVNIQVTLGMYKNKISRNSSHIPTCTDSDDDNNKSRDEPDLEKDHGSISKVQQELSDEDRSQQQRPCNALDGSCEFYCSKDEDKESFKAVEHRPATILGIHSRLDEYWQDCRRRLCERDYWRNLVISLFLLVFYIGYAYIDVLDDSEILGVSYMADQKYIWIYFAVVLNGIYLNRNHVVRAWAWATIILISNVYTIIDLMAFTGAEAEETTVNSRGLTLSMDTAKNPLVFVNFIWWRIGTQFVLMIYSLEIPAIAAAITERWDSDEMIIAADNDTAVIASKIITSTSTNTAAAASAEHELDEKIRVQNQAGIVPVTATTTGGGEETVHAALKNDEAATAASTDDGKSDLIAGTDSEGDPSLGTLTPKDDASSVSDDAIISPQITITIDSEKQQIETTDTETEQGKSTSAEEETSTTMTAYKHKMKNFMRANIAVFILICAVYVVYLAISGDLKRTAGTIFFSTVISVVMLINIRAFYSFVKWFWLHAYGFDTPALRMMFGARNNGQWSLPSLTSFVLKPRSGFIAQHLPFLHMSTERKIRTVDGWMKKIAHTYDGLVVFILSAESFSEGENTSDTYSFAYAVSLIYMLLYAVTYSSDGSWAWIIYGAKARVMDGYLGRENEIFGYMFDKYMLPASVPLLLWLQASAEKDDVVYLSWAIFMPIIVGDSFAEIVGGTWGRQKIKVWGMGEVNKKSWEGTLAMFLSSFLILLAVNIYEGLDYSWYLFAFVNCLMATFIELYAYRSTDNVCMMVASTLLAVAFVHLKEK